MEIVGRQPGPNDAADAFVGLIAADLMRPDLGVRRGRGRPPHEDFYCELVDQDTREKTSPAGL